MKGFKGESQQPLGLALSFYFSMKGFKGDFESRVSTAAWACIEFLLKGDFESRTAIREYWSQQPLGLALSFYSMT